MTTKKKLVCGVDYYNIKVVYYDLDNASERKRLVANSFKVTDHVVTTQHLSFSIVGKTNEYQYISNHSIVGFILKDFTKYEQNKIKLQQ